MYLILIVKMENICMCLYEQCLNSLKTFDGTAKIRFCTTQHKALFAIIICIV